jgi:hypothetical protein
MPFSVLCPALLFFQSSSADSGTFVCCVVFPVIFLVILILAGIAGNSDEKRRRAQLKAAADAYYASLEALKRNPTNPEVRQQTLHLGRAYSNLTRNKKGVSLYDEVALSNDINAACAAAGNAGPFSNSEPAPTTGGLSIEQRLSRLQDLRSQGIITDEEYQARRSKILDEV